MRHVKNYLYSLAISLGAGLLLSAAAYAQGISGVGKAVSCLCWNLMQIIPVISMLMIIGAGIVYATGQILGAETRARASQWGTAMLIGAVIGILIVTVAPTVLKAMYPASGRTGQIGSTGICLEADCAP